ncbi:hypothetical protein KKC16_00350 [Patescibacteria group bacterium]|nr:hypothetical protein [Patescibacteria group bacterium]MBU4481892.1 hypothetical protein [Patescibacteria group bacterium]
MPNNIQNKLIKLFSKIKIDKSWSFADKTRKDTAYITHGYHRYPAKFIPQIVSRLVEKYTKEGDLVVDPFGGCGTTATESKVSGRSSIAVDINPVAVLIAKAKITPIQPLKLEEVFIDLKYKLNLYNQKKVKMPVHERIDYWFKPEQKQKLSFIFLEISKIKDEDIKNFFYCAFSNILKTCSIWLQKSNKPTRDLKKKVYDPFNTFYKQIKMMLRGNFQFYNLLKEKSYLEVPAQIVCADARKIPVKNNTVDLIVTSPPYVTSYEYADLHQLTALWFEYTKDLSNFRKKFIGTSHNGIDKKIKLNSELAEKINIDLEKMSKKLAREVAVYFTEMNQCFVEMKRILKKNGRACIVIGNTSLKKVEILNAEVFIEQMQNLGFRIDDIIKREIPSKNLPSMRDEKTGKFAQLTTKNKKYAYPTEYILIMRKI